ncbi:phycobiliprotein lyase [Prochlorococcus marinus]|uniref:phycobiliprotein lyase n=1 Tax=Prochlorococcus marinus TaxID=1219 RepID=UPI0022B45AED|nr:phycobiliprotein lyase [Prochlorococcus marinus]
MNIEEFFLKSVGEWNSMRSGHSLAFQEFEEIRSKIKIFPSKRNDSRVTKFLKDNLINTNVINKTFLINWEAKSEWDEENQKENSSGESILVPIEVSKTEGKIIRSVGYTQAIKVVSLYKILADGTLIIYSDYSDICTEERIWFVSNNVRSRSSVTRAIGSLAILQTSYASEIRYIKK